MKKFICVDYVFVKHMRKEIHEIKELMEIQVTDESLKSLQDALGSLFEVGNVHRTK